MHSISLKSAGLWRRFRCLLAANRGSSAVEIALLSPILMVMLVGLVEAGRVAYDRTDMFSAARSGAQYFMAGGQDLQAARAIILNAWTSAPEDAGVTINRTCLCQTTPNACDALCPDESIPDVFVRIELTAVLRGVLTDYSTLAVDTVRVR